MLIVKKLDFSKKVAIYNLTSAFKGESICLKFIKNKLENVETHESPIRECALLYKYWELNNLMQGRFME